MNRQEIIHKAIIDWEEKGLSSNTAFARYIDEKLPEEYKCLHCRNSEEFDFLHTKVSKEDAEYIWNLLPDWVKEQPEGLPSHHYYTLSRKGDIEIKNTVRKILGL